MSPITRRHMLLLLIVDYPRNCSTPTADAEVNGGIPAATCSARRWRMLRIFPLTPAQQREVRRWQAADDPHLARRAPVVPWSAPVRSRARPRAGLLPPHRAPVGAGVPGRWAHRPPRS